MNQYRYSSSSLLQLDCNFQDPWKNKVEYLLRMLNQMLKNLPINQKDVVIYETGRSATAKMNMMSIKHYIKRGRNLLGIYCDLSCTIPWAQIDAPIKFHRANRKFELEMCCWLILLYLPNLLLFQTCRSPFRKPTS